MICTRLSETSPKEPLGRSAIQPQSDNPFNEMKSPILEQSTGSGESGGGGQVAAANAKSQSIDETNNKPKVDKKEEEIQDLKKSYKQSIPGGIDVRRIGAGSQILRDLGVQKIALLGSKTRYPSISGFGLEVVKYIQK